MTSPPSSPSGAPGQPALVPLPVGTLVLASSSPRRREILGEMGLEFEIHIPDIDETALPQEAPEALVTRLAEGKALAVARHLPKGQRRWVLGSDTVVVLDAEIIGKPTDENDAIAMLERLTNRTHRVVTGVAVVDAQDGGVLSQAVTSEVVMRPAQREEIRAYVATGESLDKAGAYALQGGGRRFVTRVEGSESNVIGLPMDETRALLARAAAGSAPGKTEAPGRSPS
ncbi:MAG: Maf family protein [Myxococcota bacterium]|jgi:septum formation protein|nr:Maf family protein [Myxococcota bacterium]